MNLVNQSQTAKLQPFKVKQPSKISVQYKTKEALLLAFSQHLFCQNSLNQVLPKFNNAKVSSFTVRGVEQQISEMATSACGDRNIM